MTLILGTATDHTLVLASDGLELELSAGGQRRPSTRSQRKMVLVPNRLMAIAVAGQNRVVAIGEEPGQAASQGMLVDRFATLKPHKRYRRVYDLARQAIDLVSDEVLYTLRILPERGLRVDPMQVVFAGFDPQTRSLQIYEAIWKPDGQFTGLTPIRHRDATVVHFGSGGPVAAGLVAAPGSDWHPDRLVRAPSSKLQERARSLYAACVADADAAERMGFGGTYQELTIARTGGAAWTTPCI